MKQDKATIQVHEICRHCGDPYTVKERIRVYGDNPLMAGYCSAGCYTQGGLMKPASPSIPVNDELDIPKGKWYFYDTIKKTYSGYGVGQWVQLEIATEFSKKPLDTQSIGKMSFTALGGNNKEDYKKATDTMQAICTAVNETFGKGINPESIQRTLAAIETTLNVLTNWNEARDDKMYSNLIEHLQTALHNAKTIKK